MLNAFVAHAPRRAASTLVSSLAFFAATDKHRDESRRGTHVCVRHVPGTTLVWEKGFGK
jgi:hypothetical protein